MRRQPIAIVLASILLVAVMMVASNRSGDAQDWRQQLATWQYPRSEIVHGGDGGSGTPTSHSVADMTTSDSLDDVARYYEEKTRLTLPSGRTDSTGKVRDGMANILQSSPQQRPLTLRVFSQHTKSYSLGIVISRDKSEKLTYIHWSYTKH